MGASVSLLYSSFHSDDQDFVGIVADAPYSDMRQSLTELLGLRYFLPRMLAQEVALEAERLMIESRGVSFFQSRPIAHIKNVKKPVVIFKPLKDETTDPHHSQDLYDTCPAEEKLLMKEEIGHNSPRSNKSLMTIADFFSKKLQ
eukprot:GHVP01059488.1.p1 GENE.GHVP01059488.1~~GHVP01059488.1.p1  ORF type:complete len:144 (-),score=22.77 GHVP01059488.1:78-509(-)